MKRFRDLIEDKDTYNKKVINNKINKLRLEKETSKDPESVQLKIDALYRELEVYLTK